MNHLVKRLTFIAALTTGFVSHLGAVLIVTPASGVLNTTRWQGDQTSQTQIDAVISPIIGNAVEQYKQNVGDASDSGPLAGSYVTTFSNTPLDPSGALIDYVSGPFIQPTAYLLVKDGSQSPAWYLFNLTALGLDPGEDIQLQDFWPNQGAISHVALYSGASTTVPEGGASVALLGLALGLMAVIRRKIS